MRVFLFLNMHNLIKGINFVALMFEQLNTKAWQQFY